MSFLKYRQIWNKFSNSKKPSSDSKGRLGFMGYTRIRVFYSVIVLVLALLSFYLFLRSDLFLVKHIEINVSGNQMLLRRDRIEGAVSKYLAKSIFAVQPDELEDELLASFMLLKNVSITKQFPDTVTVEYSEREPVAIIHIGGLDYLVSENGLIYYRIDTTEKYNLPIIYMTEEVNGDVLGSILEAEQVKKVIEIVQEDWSSLDVKLLRVEYLESAFLFHFEGFTVTFSSTKNSFDQLKDLRVIIQDAKLQGKTLESIDLRFDQAVVRYL